MAAMHFVLVHGAYHGAWCWDLLRRELEGAGHTTSAVDLPNEDPAAGAERYAGEVLAAAPNTADGIVLVGHSLGGLTIPIVAGRIRTRMAIYLCALLPVPGLSFDAQHADFDTGFMTIRDGGRQSGRQRLVARAGAIEVFYHDCDPQVAIASAQRLRPQQWRITQEVTPLREWPSVPSAYITCTDDRVVSKAYSGARLGSCCELNRSRCQAAIRPFFRGPRN